jgi:hypothetical protein
VIAGDHEHAHAGLVARRERRLGVRAERIREADQANDLERVGVRIVRDRAVHEEAARRPLVAQSLRDRAPRALATALQ